MGRPRFVTHEKDPRQSDFHGCNKTDDAFDKWIVISHFSIFENNKRNACGNTTMTDN